MCVCVHGSEGSDNCGGSTIGVHKDKMQATLLYIVAIFVSHGDHFFSLEKQYSEHSL